jgi:hypothetical protein
MRAVLCILAGALGLAAVSLPAGSLAGEEFPARLRYPVAAVWLDARTVVTANERSGSLSLVDLDRGRVRAEIPIGGRPVGLATTGDGNTLFVIDRAGHVLTSHRYDGECLEPRDRLALPRDPAGLVVTNDGRRAVVATRWSRTLALVDAAPSGELTLAATLPLPFAAQRLLLLPDQRHLVVADAFGGRLAIVDLARPAVVSDRELQGHHLHGLAWDAAQDRLLVAHQVLNSPLPIDFDNVQWGAAMRNVVRAIGRAQLLDPDVNLTTATRVYALGQEGDGSGDPAAVAPLADGGFAVALGGAHELALVESTGLLTRRLPLGRRPIALLARGGTDQLIAVNQFDQSLTLIDPSRGVVAELSLGPLPTLKPAERGEQLFYDARLSFERWMSCHSCHTDGHTHGLRADTQGDGHFGAPKRTLTLLGVRDTDRWAWNGSIKELSEQVRKSIATSMHGEATADRVFDLTNFLHTLDPPPPLAPPTDEADRRLIARGERVFERQRCVECHIPPLTYTAHDVFDVGLADERGERKFNPPSLRGVGQGTRFFHDGRATALEDVLDVYGHQVREPLSDDERAALLRFLRSL